MSLEPQQKSSDAEAAAELGQWFDTLLEASPMAIGIVSAFENRYLRANQAMAELYGMSIAEILANEPFSMALRITHPDDVVAEQKLFAELVAGTRRSYQFEKRYVRSDGSFRWGLLTFSGIFAQQRDLAAASPVLRFALIQVIDITDKKALAETLKRRDEELEHAQKIDGIGRLAAGVAHDFNNLLTVIMGHAGLLKHLVHDTQGAGRPPAMEGDLEAILAASERAASLTTQLLAYGRRTPLAPRALVLSNAVATLQRLLERTLGSSVEIEQSLNATGCIFADESQIGQVVMNLVLNARDALPEGGRIRLATQDVAIAPDARDATPPGPGGWVSLIVADTGHGMSPEVQARMFEPFFTTRAERPGTQGTGLGLATVQRIVAQAGGHISVRSEIGAGTAISVFFPRFAGAQEDIEPVRTQLRPAAVANSRRVLVVDDEPSVRALIATVLLGARYWVMAARDGQEALHFIDAEREPFDLIVTDLLMPGLGGVALAKRLHERGGHPPHVLFVSGYSGHGSAELTPYGSLLPKPFTPSQLLEAVSRALGDSS